MHQTFVLFGASAVRSDFNTSAFNVNILHLGVVNTHCWVTFWFGTVSSDTIFILNYIISIPEEIISFSLIHTVDTSQYVGDNSA